MKEIKHFCVLLLDVGNKLLPSNWERSEEVHERHGCTYTGTGYIGSISDRSRSGDGKLAKTSLFKPSLFSIKSFLPFDWIKTYRSLA